MINKITSNLFGGNIADISFDVAVPSVNPTEMAGATGALSFSTKKMDNPKGFRNKTAIVEKSGLWAVAGRISDISWGAQATLFTAETALQRLNINVYIPPQYHMSEADAMDQALALAGFVSEGLPTTNSVVFPGYAGTLLDYVKFYCNAYVKEYYLEGLDFNTLHFRDLLDNDVTSTNKDSLSFSITDQALAQTVEVLGYRYTIPATTLANIEFTPAGETDPQIITVDAGASVTTDITLNAWVQSVNQPVCTTGVGPEERVDAGVYQVLGNDGLPVPPDLWRDRGGSLVVSTTDDPSVIRVVLSAPAPVFAPGSDTDSLPSPYSIAVSDGETSRSSLHITGKGVRYHQTTYTVPTGVPNALSYEKVGVTVDNPFVNTAHLIWDTGARAAQAYSGAAQSCTFSISDAREIENVLGARVRTDGVDFRTNSVSYGGGLYALSCTGYSIIDAFDETWDGLTFDDFDTFWDGKTFDEFDSDPLLGV